MQWKLSEMPNILSAIPDNGWQGRAGDRQWMSQIAYWETINRQLFPLLVFVRFN